MNRETGESVLTAVYVHILLVKQISESCFHIEELPESEEQISNQSARTKEKPVERNKN